MMDSSSSLYKPTPSVETLIVFNLIDMFRYIDEKYKIDQRNYVGKSYRKDSPDYTEPYQDFWHFLIEFIPNFNNGTYSSLIVNEGLIEACEEEWQKEIARLWVTEYKEYASSDSGEVTIWVSW